MKSDPIQSSAIVWLRRDLRLGDNVALMAAARSGASLCIAFNLDPELLRSQRVGAPLVQTFFDALRALRETLRALGSDLVLLEGSFEANLVKLARDLDARALYYNEDYEPGAIARDERVTRALESAGVAVRAHLDHVYFGAGELSTDGGDPYKVFTPYKRRWLERYRIASRKPVASERAIAGRLIPRERLPHTRDVPHPQEFGHEPSRLYPQCGETYARGLLETFLRAEGPSARYATERDIPSLEGTSRLSPQLRAGTIGIRTCFERAFAALERAEPAGARNIETWISELIWREFYQMILRRFPHVATQPFVPAARGIVWNDDRAAFERWCAGQTGYPIVDAAMTQLNATGWMHNRLRMIAASFLTKDLLITWQWGERYFEQHLADADLAQNNGGWQWSASSGTDAAPYFRVFNPILQSKKYDPEGTFIRAQLPALRNVPAKYVHAPWEMPPLLQAQSGCVVGSDYPFPIVDHAAARDRALDAYAAALGKLRVR